MSPMTQAVVVVPAHDEFDALPRSISAISAAASGLAIPTLTVVVLDACSDGSERLIGRFGPDVHFVSIEAGNVGAARAAGFDYARQLSADAPLEGTWYATTDADSSVTGNWLRRMLAADADMVLGVVRIADWQHYPVEAVARYLRAYDSTGPAHDHVHGANMGFRADVYWRLGGFRALATDEDVDLVGRFETAGATIRRDSRLSVTTSARREARAPGGFAAHLRELSDSVRHRSRIGSP